VVGSIADGTGKPAAGLAALLLSAARATITVTTVDAMMAARTSAEGVCFVSFDFMFVSGSRLCDFTPH
jgi:hypothetical protein